MAEPLTVTGRGEDFQDRLRPVFGTALADYVANVSGTVDVFDAIEAETETDTALIEQGFTSLDLSAELHRLLLNALDLPGHGDEE